MSMIGSIVRHDDLVVALPAGGLASTPRAAFNRVEDRQFLQMQQVYSRTGGLLSGTDVAHRLRRHRDQPLSTLARWIVARAIVNFEWHSHILVPMFQFEPEDMSLRPAMVELMREFKDVLDDWECACWFAEPNVWLHDAAPVDLLRVEPAQVLDAARADRFIVRG